ncbi:MAG TPA: peptidase S9, partial [Rhodothermales bacterium]|nr:peptidase S9 [Rhodothermales bacterium]
RTYLNTFGERKPILLYANDADFQQTNAVGGLIGEGTGGVTESLKERVTMPLTGIYAENDHVLGHELVHSFQYDIALNKDTTGFALDQLPLWLIEGTAEYLSIGRIDPFTAMWMRDAALRDDLPTTDQLTRDTRYFPYRYGQAYMAYVGGKYGDAAVANLYRLAGRVGVDSAFVYALGITADSLSKEWAQTVKATYLPLSQGRTPAAEAGTLMISERRGGGRLNVSPTLSPDGRYVAYISERDLFNVNLFIADARTGRIVQKLRETNSDAHFDAIRFINSAGTWSPDGKRFAFVTFAQGDNELSIFDLDRGRVTRRIAIEGVGAFANPAWSPDGRTIALSGLKGGISDLYLLDVETRQVRQLTSDRYADLQPNWSPDGRTLAFVTDRGPEGTNFETLEYGELRLATIDVASSDIRIIRPFGRAEHHNPQFSADGRSLFFISDQDGFRDIYRTELASGQTFRVTNLQTGVAGITGLSPALSVARQTGDLAYSVFADNKYNIFGRTAADAQGTPVTPRESGIATAGVLPPIQAAGQGLVASYLRDPTSDLPPPFTDTAAPDEPYRARLQLDAVAPPSLGVGVGGYYGSGVQGGVGFLFSDLLGNRVLSAVVQANGTFKDIGGQATYLNLKHRLSLGGQIGHIPTLYYGGTNVGSSPEDGDYIENIRIRTFETSAAGIAQYPFSQTRRLEFNLGALRYGFDMEADRFTGCDFITGYCQGFRRVNLSKEDGFDRPTVYLAQGNGALVGDYSNFGFTSPVQGGRYRFQIGGYAGTYDFVQGIADYRRYFFFRPVTFAIRGMHIGNYGINTTDDIQEFRVGQVFLTSSYYPTFVRGYGYRSFEEEECFAVATEGGGIDECPVFTRLQGTRAVIANAEVRVPLLGVREFGLINFPYLPTELSFFTDAGLTWTGFEGERGTVFESSRVRPFDFASGETARKSLDRIPVVSTGVSARFNVLGYAVFEVFYAYPFQRPDKGAHFGFALSPGW